MTAPPALVRAARSADVDFLARVDLQVDEESGETYAMRWGVEERAEHRDRIAAFVADHDKVAYVADARDHSDPPVAMLLAYLRDLSDEAAPPFLRMFPETLWPALPSGWAPSDGRFAEMFQLWVDPRWRRRGLASALKHRLEQYARQQGITLLYTHTRALNAHVVELNEKLGYVAFRTGPLWDATPRVSLAKRLRAVDPGAS